MAKETYAAKKEAYAVKITEFDDTIEAYANDKREEKSPIDSSFHKICGATIQVFRTSSTHDVIVCSGRCRLRVPFPFGITTLGQLRDHFQRFNK